MLWRQLGEHFLFKSTGKYNPSLHKRMWKHQTDLQCFEFPLLPQLKQHRSRPCTDSDCTGTQKQRMFKFIHFWNVDVENVHVTYALSSVSFHLCRHVSRFILFQSEVSCLVVFRPCSWSALVCSFSVFYIKLSNRFWLWLLPHTLKRGDEEGKEGGEYKMKKVSWFFFSFLSWSWTRNIKG